MQRFTNYRYLALLIILLFAGLGAQAIARPEALTGAPAGPTPAQYLPLMPYAPVLPPPDSIQLEVFAPGVENLTISDLASAGDDRLFVVERRGVIRIVTAAGNYLPTPFLNIGDKVSQDNWEEGLLGMVFHPDYENNGYFYIAYNGLDQQVYYNITIERYQVSADPNVADPDSAAQLFYIDKPDEVHNGGDLSFGPDGYLYISLGDGGPDPLPPGDPNEFPGDPLNNAQRLTEILGSMLRIDVDLGPGLPPDCGGDYYTIPADNPFVDGPGGKCDEIWHYGFRNAWRFSFDRETGDMWIGDVGEWRREELNFVPAGSPGGVNFGWHCFEGNLDYTTIWPELASDCNGTYTPPLLDYEHGPDCSVTPGFVYRGQEFYALRGHYLFADFCTGIVYRAAPGVDGWERVFLAASGKFLTTFGEDANGELYVGTHNDGTIFRVVLP